MSRNCNGRHNGERTHPQTACDEGILQEGTIYGLAMMPTTATILAIPPQLLRAGTRKQSSYVALHGEDVYDAGDEIHYAGSEGEFQVIATATIDVQIGRDPMGNECKAKAGKLIWERNTAILL